MYLEYSRNQQSVYKGSLPSCLDVRGQAEDSRKARFNHDEFDEELSVTALAYHSAYLDNQSDCAKLLSEQLRNH
jgi:hypothetical protein